MNSKKFVNIILYFLYIKCQNVYRNVKILCYINVNSYVNKTFSFLLILLLHFKDEKVTIEEKAE